MGTARSMNGVRKGMPIGGKARRNNSTRKTKK
jgi:hypothetical protein